MNKKFTKLMAALALLVFMTPTMAGWGQTRENIIVLSEDFSNGKPSTWSYTGNTSIQSGTLQIASNNGAGSATTPAFSTLVGTTATLSFTAVSSTSASRTLTITGNSCSVNGAESTTVTATSSVQTFTIAITNASASSTIKFSAAKSQGTKIDDVLVYYLSNDPTLNIDKTTLTGMTYSQGNGPSEAKTFTLSGSNLTNNIVVSLGDNSDFEMSMDNVTYQTDDFELSKGNGTVSDKIFYVRLASGKGVNTYESSVSITSTGATSKTVSLSGSVTGYTVTYNCNGGTSGCPENATNVPLGNYTLASAPSKDHYTFGGWNDGTNTYNAGVTYNITGDVTFTAQWTPITHTFSTAITPANSGSVEAKNSSNETVASGSPVAETAQLTLTATPAEGYNFTSWSDGDNNSTLSSTSNNPTTFTMGTSNVTITATFTARTPAKVTLHHGEGGNTTTVVNTYIDATVGDLMAPATVNGWTTMGWVLSYTSGDPALVSSSTVIDAIDDDNHELTLYAVYTKGSNTFSRITSTDDLESGTYMICGYGGSNYYLMDGAGTNVMNRTTAITVTNNSFEYSVGKKFVLGGTSGAYTFYDGSKYLSTEETSNSTLLTLSDELGDYGKWDISFTTSGIVQIKKNNSSRYVSYYHNSSAFNCYTNPNTVYLFKQTSNDLQITTTPVGDKCTVTYDVNGGDGTAPTDNTQYNVGATVTVADGTGLSKTGYSFNGWNTKADGTGTAHAAGSTFNITVNTTLYAQWAINSYAYTLNMTGADAGASAVLKVDNENVGANAQIQYNKEVTVVVTLSDAEAYVYTVSVVNNTTSEAVTVSNNKFTMPNSAVTVTVTTVVNPYREIELTSDNMTNMTGTLAYGNLKTVTINGYTWETTGYQVTDRDYVQINTTGTGNPEGSYIKIPEVGGKIMNITFSVTNGNGNNTTTTLYVNTTNSTSNPIANSESTSSKSRTINLTGVFCNKGYIVSDGTIRIYNIKVTYLPYSNFTDLASLPASLSAGDNVAVASDMSTDNLTIPATAGLVVKSGAKLTITGTLTNSGTAANLVVLDGGQLNATSANVAATMKKTITGHENNLGGGWNFIASPMTSTVIANTAHTNVITGNYDLYRFNQSAELEWENYEAVVENTTQPLHTDFTTLVNGTGYLYANDTTIDVAFMGTLANPTSGDVSVSYDGYAALKGWNLVGNPFTCNAYLSGGFFTTGEPGAVVVACENTTPIAPCEGAMVYVESAGTVTFSKTAPRTANNGNVSIAVVQANERGASATTVDKAIVSFNEGSELPKFYFGNPNANLYIPQNDKEYAIATSEAQGEMPLNFRANEDGQYTLTVNPEGVEMNYLHLIDNMTGANVDLLSTPSYTFTAKTTDYESRFRLVFAANNESGVSASSTTFAFYSNGNWMVNNEGEATLQVIDVMGRVLSNQTISGTAELSLNQQPGVYVLRLVNGNDVKTQKIVVR